MKVSTSILIASGIILASTIYARPPILKRAGNVADAIGCITPFLLNPMKASMTVLTACQSKLSQDFGVVKSASVANLQFDLRGETPTIASSDITISLMSIDNLSSVPVSRVKINDGPHSAGSFASEWLPTTAKGFSFDMVLPATTLTVTTEQIPYFIASLSATAKTSHDVVLSGTADAEVIFSLASVLDGMLNPLGLKVPAIAPRLVPVNSLGVTVPFTLKGFNNFGGAVQGHFDSPIQTTATGERTIKGSITFTSPSDVSTKLGDIDFQLWSKDAVPESLGIATVENLSLTQGTNTYVATIKVDAAVKIEKYFPAQAGLRLSVNGFTGSSKNPFAAAAVASLKFDLVF